MNKTKKVANYLVKRYEELTQSNFGNSELKLQKLMYFVQKHSFAFAGKEMFSEDFEGWRYGPVLVSLRGYFELPVNYEGIDDLKEEEKYIIDNVIYEYGAYDGWKLRDLSHQEEAWKKSREGLNLNENGKNIIDKSNIRKDAEKVRLYDHVFDMYVDEFEDE